jgi:hypothetical protein
MSSDVGKPREMELHVSLLSRPMLRTYLALLGGSVLYSFCSHGTSHISLLLATYHIFCNVVDNIIRSLNERSAQFDLKIFMCESNRDDGVTASGAVVSAALLWYYLIHLEKDPITGRMRFIAISHEQLLQIAQIELEMVSSFCKI